MKEYLTFLRALGVQPNYQIQLRVIPRISFWGWGLIHRQGIVLAYDRIDNTKFVYQKEMYIDQIFYGYETKPEKK